MFMTDSGDVGTLDEGAGGRRDDERHGALSLGHFERLVPELAGLDQADPMATWGQLVGRPPHAVPGTGITLLSRHRDVEEATRSPHVTMRRAASDAHRGADTQFFLHVDPPLHTKLRARVNRAFTPRSIAALEPFIEEQVAAAFAGIDPDSPTDLVDRIARPLPTLVMCELLGIPHADAESVHDWSAAVSLGGDMIGRPRSRADQRANREGLTNLRRYFRGLVGDREAEPRDDIISRLLATDRDGEGLTRRQVVLNAEGLLVTGQDTTHGLIAHGMAKLIEEPHWADPILTEPGFVDAFIEEVLRFESPNQVTLRIAATDLVVGGTRIDAGGTMLVVIPAANRDPEAFERADEFDPRRDAGRSHLAFGSGIHYCIGAATARLEARIVLTELARRIQGRPVQVLERHYDDRYRQLRVMTSLQVSGVGAAEEAR